MIPFGPPGPLGPPTVATQTTITVSGIETPEQARKRTVMENLFQVGVIFKHKRSRVLWEVMSVQKTDDGNTTWAVMKSKKSGYTKWFKPGPETYDTLNLHEAPEALKILFGDQKHVEASTTTPVGDPQEAEQAFDVDLTEDQIE